MIALAGCSAAQPADRAGGDTVLLRMGTNEAEVNTNGQLVGLETFVEQLTEVSGGRLQVEFAFQYGDDPGGADAESRVIDALVAGDLDGGWPSTRSFAGAGIRGLEAVEAPMTLSSSAAVGALVTGPAAATALGALEDSGVKALALTAGSLRRPFAAGTPLLSPEDWADQRFRVYGSPVQAETVTALGGIPVNLGFGWMDEVLAGRLRGAEFEVAQYASNGWGTEAGAVTADVVLWPKVYVLALSQKRFDSLNEQQQDWVQQAATRAAEASVADAVADDARAEDLCGRGVRFIPAGPEQLAALRAAVAPVVEGLSADPVTAPLMEQVLAIAREHPDVESVDVPAECGTMALTGAEPSAAPSIPAETAAIPNGIYRVELSAARWPQRASTTGRAERDLDDHDRGRHVRGDLPAGGQAGPRLREQLLRRSARCRAAAWLRADGHLRLGRRDDGRAHRLRPVGGSDRGRRLLPHAADHPGMGAGRGPAHVRAHQR
jgi:TRAP-type C4-dicarboxylate transport system substrate-binding protein